MINNDYFFIDEDNKLIDIFVFDDLSATDEVINSIKNLVGATKVIKRSNETEPINSIQGVSIYGAPVIGYIWDEVDTFIPPKPGENYILDKTRTVWVEIPANNSGQGA